MNSHDKFPLDAFGIEPESRQSHPPSRDDSALADLVTTVVALDYSRPLYPQVHSFDIISEKLFVHPALSLKHRCIAWSGWAAAVAIALLFLLDRMDEAGKPILTEHGKEEAGKALTPGQSPSVPANQSLKPSQNTIRKKTRSSDNQVAIEAATIREQQRSLIQEIDILRKQVSILVSRDTERLAVQNGVSWPIIMKLTVPGTDPEAAIVQYPLLGALLRSDSNDTTAPSDSQELTASNESSAVSPAPSLPSAVPIYDPARDAGQLLVSNLDKPVYGQAYFLWVQPDNSSQPVLVGTLPDNIASTESFDFKLGSVGIIPDRFMITQDFQQAPQLPTATNTVLLGPGQSPK